MVVRRVVTPLPVRLLTALTLALLAAASPWTHGQVAATSATVIRGPYLQIGTPFSVVVRWRTDAPVIGAVQYGPSPGTVSGSAKEASERTEHEVKLTGLAPDTLYYYSVGTPTATLAGDSTFHFRTSPLAGTERPVRVWVVGDSGTGDANARAVRDAYAGYTGTTPTDLWLMLGDNAYQDGLDTEYQSAVFSMFKVMLRKTVLWPAFGNHDGYGSNGASQTGPYFDMFTLPANAQAGGVASGTEAYYSFDYANIHFICLESYDIDRSPNGTMMTWLQRDLAANAQPWVIAYFHHPPYSKGSHDSDTEIELIEMRQNALPILENAGVDLVLTGHSHSYERSYLIDGHYGYSTTFTASMEKDGGSGRPDGSGAYSKPTYGMAPHQGTVYLVAGTGGQLGGGPLNHPAMYVSQSVLGSLILDVNGKRLDATFVDSTGARRDYFSIVKGTTSSPPPTTSAYGGTAWALPGTIEAENFDQGGQSMAYYDTTPGNKGGSYRNTDVDIGPAADAGGGYYIGWTRAGEWLTYTVNIGSTGTYSLDTRVANVGTGATFHVEVDGVNKTGSIAVPDTGAWDAWRTLTTPGISLPSGQHLVRVVLDTIGSGGAVGGFNWFRFSASTSSPTTAYGGTPAPIPGTIQAENFDTGGQSVAYYDTTPGNKGGSYRNTDVDIGPTADAGGGYYIGWTRAGEWLTYSVNVGAAGTYTLSTRVANVGTGATFHVEIDGVDRTGAIPVPDTGAWDAWQTIAAGGVSLSAGSHVMRVVLDTIGSGGAVGGFNWFRLSSET
jgi:Carbohydrate binding module (family 6)/Calcineurin-like phosphoesterase/Purple acid Phosphatase, N-terminal domain